MSTNFTMPYARFRWYDDIIPMSHVQEIELQNYSSAESGGGDEFYVKLWYVGAGSNVNTLKFESAEQREEILDRINDLLLRTQQYFKQGGASPTLTWEDFTPEPEPAPETSGLKLNNLNKVMDEIQEALGNPPEVPEKPIQLQEPDNRAAWRKFLKPNP